MFFIKENKIGLAKELRRMFPKEEFVRLENRGNSRIFSSDERIIKYLPEKYLKPYFDIYDLLKGRTNIGLPEILDVKKSEVLESYIVVMKKNRGDLLADVWKDFSMEEQGLILKKMMLLLKKINSVSLNPKDVPKSLIFFSRDLSWNREVKEFCLTKLDEYEKNGFIKKSLHNSFLLILNENIDYIASIDYVLSHRDFHFNNLLIDKNFNLTLLFDFETFGIGDKYLDLVIAGSFLREKYQKMFFDLYGRPKNFEEISKVYRLIMSISFFKKVDIKEEKEVIEFIEKGFPFFNFELKKNHEKN